MRITPQQRQRICQQIDRHFGAGAEVWLFGSRVDDQKKGGDVDLYIETTPHPLLSELRCKIALQDALEMPVDLIVRQPQDTSPIAMIAKSQGLKL